METLSSQALTVSLAMRRRILCGIGVVVLLAAVIAGIVHASFLWKRKECKGVVRALAYAVAMYRDMHDKMFPPNLSVSVSEEASSPRLLVCPGTGKNWGSYTNAEVWADYLYINWSRYYGTNEPPGDYPLVYDRRLSNHKGRGVNIGAVDGSVRWDPNAVSLRVFATKHPEYDVPLPR